MKRHKTNIALFLLAVYLPMWLLSSFHVHAHPLNEHQVSEEHHSSEMDEDGCLLCQFLQLAYEEAPLVVVTVNRTETQMESVPRVQAVVSAFEQTFSSRAPPVLS
jgi:hypothetical protein